MRKLLILACVVTGMVEGIIRAEKAQEIGLTPERFARIHALIMPQEGEDAWARIPWLTSLTEARRRAAAEGKPILLWEMDGHPLGCT